MPTAIEPVKRGASDWWWILGAVAVVYSALHWNPAGYFMDAGATAYYQARIAVQRGGLAERGHVMEAYRDGKITQAEYSKHVFPAYLKVVQSGEDLFPADERAKPIEQLRKELGVMIDGRVGGASTLTGTLQQ